LAVDRSFYFFPDEISVLDKEVDVFPQISKPPTMSQAYGKQQPAFQLRKSQEQQRPRQEAGKSSEKEKE
jgi:hypothetical protein